MGNYVTSISVTRDTWRVLLMSQIAYLYSIVFDRLQRSRGNDSIRVGQDGGPWDVPAWRRQKYPLTTNPFGIR